MQDLRAMSDELKGTVRSVLGDVPSQIFLHRVDKVIDEGMSDIESLRNSCAKVENLVKLFIGVEESKVIGRRFREVLDRAA